MVALLQFATVLCDACGTPFGCGFRPKAVPCRLVFEISYSRRGKRWKEQPHDHPLLLCRELLLEVVMYSSSGRHSSG